MLSALLFATFARAATAPQWMWTPAKASYVVGGKCKGLGSGIAGRFLSFRCAKKTKTIVWVKIRRSGSGRACRSTVSLAKVPPACLKIPVPIPPGSVSEASEAAGLAIAVRFDPNATSRYQRFLPQCTGGKGHYTCTGKDKDLSIAAKVDWTQAGPKVTFTSFVCSGAYVGRPGC